MLADRPVPQGARAAQRSSTPLSLAIIDRDTGLIQVLGKRLAAAGWEHKVVSSPLTPQALVRLRLNALIVDISVVGPEWWVYLEEVCMRLPGLGVVVCTGPSSVAQRIRGLRLGVDAWVTKPCHAEELICVTEASVRRHRRAELDVVDAPVQAGELMLRAELHQAYVGSASLDLTAREFEILQLLARSDRVLRREEIYERVWGYAMAHGDRSVDVFIGKVRQKLRLASPRWNYIHTHFGVGYRFDPAPDLGEDGPDRAGPSPGLAPEVRDIPSSSEEPTPGSLSPQGGRVLTTRLIGASRVTP
ncbi:MAG TPA: response regulator transcription factor [Solirubrobacteraceae bacterium]|nr:response regulator transcription factor [Solirubrobacteraceae bacterium]